jgi:hypothetical protein
MCLSIFRRNQQSKTLNQKSSENTKQSKSAPVETDEPRVPHVSHKLEVPVSSENAIGNEERFKHGKLSSTVGDSVSGALGNRTLSQSTLTAFELSDDTVWPNLVHGQEQKPVPSIDGVDLRCLENKKKKAREQSFAIFQG